MGLASYQEDNLDARDESIRKSQRTSRPKGSPKPLRPKVSHDTHQGISRKESQGFQLCLPRIPRARRKSRKIWSVLTLLKKFSQKIWRVLTLMNQLLKKYRWIGFVSVVGIYLARIVITSRRKI